MFIKDTVMQVCAVDELELKRCVIYFKLNFDNKWSLKLNYYNSVPKFFKAYVLLLAHLSQKTYTLLGELIV